MIDNTVSFLTRPGIAPIKSKKQPAIDKRIEEIGQLADRQRDCLDRGDYWGLVELSYDYDRRKYMHKTAALLRTEAALMKKGKS